jgi:hypothetical protein
MADTSCEELWAARRGRDKTLAALREGRPALDAFISVLDDDRTRALDAHRG